MSEVLTTISRSVESHYACLAAEDSRIHDGRMVILDEFVQEAE